MPGELLEVTTKDKIAAAAAVAAVALVLIFADRPRLVFGVVAGLAVATGAFQAGIGSESGRASFVALVAFLGLGLAYLFGL